jgi:phosphotriesterase-related protein
MRGPVDTAELGPTLMHEHIFILSPEIINNYPEVWGEGSVRIDDAVDKLNELYESGVKSVVDLTVIGLGRYIPHIQKVAARTKLNIVVATGVYTFNELPHYFAFRAPRPEEGKTDVMADLFVKDMEEGFADTGVKAGILKCATDLPGLTPGVERGLRATAQAHRRTGVPISTHTHAASKRGLDQQRVFREEGVDLSRVVIGHCGDTTDLDYLQELMKAGSYIGMDRFGLEGICGFDDRVNTVAELCRRGFAGQMVLSHDANCFMDWMPEGLIETWMPHWHYMHIHHDVMPALKARGVSEEHIHQMMVVNPKKVFDTATGSY